MLKAHLKRNFASLGHQMGLSQACGWLGDFLEIRRSRYLLSMRWKTLETFLILAYHRVNDNSSRFAMDAVSTQLFDRQMKYLANHFNVLSLEEILDRLRSSDKLPSRCLAITFDDGYEDNYLCAFPILKKYSLSATVFLTAGCIAKGERLWFDRVLQAFEKTCLNSVELPGPNSGFLFRNSVDKSRAAFQTLNYLMTLPGSTRLSQIETILSQLRVEESGRLHETDLLSWPQVQEMAESGVSFGSHTLSHPVLSKISLAEAERELVESKKLIESHVERPVRVFAYPNGRLDDYSPEVMVLIKKAGYDAALTTISGANYRTQDPLQLKRLSPWQRDLPSFALSLSFYHLAPQ